MNKAGKCFPSTKTLSGETGLSERAVCTHLEIAENDGWVKKSNRKMPGRAWKRNEYQAMIPDKALKDVQHLNAKGTEPDAQGTEPDDSKALKDVQSNSRVNSTKNSRIHTSDSIEYRLSSLLYKLMLENNPKARQPDLQKWARHIDLAIRRDNRTAEEVEAVIRWSQQHHFWRSNILSTEKLRTQFDKLWLQMKETPKNATNHGQRRSCKSYSPSAVLAE